jgi:hypothetical protein
MSVIEGIEEKAHKDEKVDRAYTLNSKPIPIDELLKMSEDEFDLFLDFIDYERNKRVAKFATWIHDSRKHSIQ